MGKKGGAMTMVSGEVKSRQPTVMTELCEEPAIRLATHELQATRDPRLILLRQPDSRCAAGFRVLRQRLLRAEREPPRVIAVSSAERREGKTTLALNLALALMEDQRSRVALVETDVRAPSLSHLLRFEPPWCFSEQLDAHRHRPGECWSLVRVDPLGLCVAAVSPRPARTRVDDGPELLQALARLRADFDYVIVDAPPILESAEVNALQDAVDGTLVVARSRRSRGRRIRRALDQIDQGPLLGVVLLD